jgi:hypothetical protein
MKINRIIFSEKDINPTISSWIHHIPFAYYIVNEFNPRLFVELGVHAGDSYFTFCDAVVKTGSATKCYGIDHWRGDKHSGFYDNSIYERVFELNNKYDSFSTLLKSDFDDALEQFNAKSIDLLHIDGLHTYEKVKHDFESWLPKMSESGIILMHDILVKRDDFGVWKYFDELKNQFNTYELKDGNGLGIVILNKNQENILSELFDSNFNVELFSNIGEKHFYKYHHNQSNERNNKLTEEIEDLKIHNKKLETNIEIVRKENNLLQKNSAEINEFKETLSRLQNEISQAKSYNSWKVMLLLHRINNELIKNFNPDFFKWLYYRIFTNKVPTELDLSKYEPVKTNYSHLKNDNSVSIYVAEYGNFFFNEIAELISLGFKELSYTTDIRNEKDGVNNFSNYHIFVAPHEFFFLSEKSIDVLNSLPKNSILINFEQIELEFFKKIFSFLSKFSQIWDINYKNVEYLKEKGYNAKYFKIGYQKNSILFNEIKSLPNDTQIESIDLSIKEKSFLNENIADRPLDVIFFGASTKRRNDFFSKYSSFFSKYNSFIYLNNEIIKHPLLNTNPKKLDATMINGLSQRTKILLNIHRSNHTFFEWHRIVIFGISNKTLVITETVDDNNFFLESEHFVSTKLNNIPKLIEYYLNNEQGKLEAQEIVNNAYQHFINKCKLDDELIELLR